MLLSRRAGPRLARRRVADLVEPFAMAHRGGGGAVTLENAAESVVFAQANYPGLQAVDGGDVRLTSDGVPFCMHDTSSGRVAMTDLTVGSATLAQLRAARMRNFASGEGWSGLAAVATEVHPSSYAEMLGASKARGLVVMPEVKLQGSVALRTAMVQATIDADMVEQTMFQSFTLADLAEAKAAGIKTVFLDDTGATSVATVAAAAPDYYSFDWTKTAAITDARLTALKAALPNLKFAPWTLTRRVDYATVKARLEGLGLSLACVVTDDIAWCGPDIANPVRTSDPYAIHGPAFPTGLGITYPGHLTGALATDRHGYTQVGGVWRQTFAYTGANPYQSFNLQGWGCRPAPWSSIQFDLWLDTADADATRWAGVAWNAPDDRTFDDSANAAAGTSRGYVCMLRQNGTLAIYRRNGPTSTLISPAVASPALAAGQKVRLLVDNLPDGSIKLTRLDTGHSTTTTAPDTTYRGGYFWFGKSVTGTGGTGAKGVWSFSSVALI